MKNWWQTAQSFLLNAISWTPWVMISLTKGNLPKIFKIKIKETKGVFYVEMIKIFRSIHSRSPRSFLQRIDSGSPLSLFELVLRLCPRWWSHYSPVFLLSHYLWSYSLNLCYCIKLFVGKNQLVPCTAFLLRLCIFISYCSLHWC